MTGVPDEADLRRRAVPIDGAFNFRDVGGYETTDGGVTRWGCLYRSDALHNLTASAQQKLIEMGLRTIVDVRTDAERQANPDALPAGGPTVIACPIPNYSTLTPRAPESLTEVYNFMLDHLGDALVEAIRILARPLALPAVLHCAAGKDRTGVVTALLLSSVGVPDEIVVSDFAATGLFLSDRFIAVLADSNGKPLGSDSPLLSANASLMSDLLERVHREHGGARNYLIKYGLSADEHDAVRARLVTHHAF